MTGALTREDAALLDGNFDAISAELVAERRRQIVDEGYTPKHDLRHPFELLVQGAVAYAVSACGPVLRERRGLVGVNLWPWEWDSFRPKDPRRDLVRAGALIIAALERIDREAAMAADVEAG